MEPRIPLQPGRQLLRLIKAVESMDSTWSEADYSAMLRHQLDTSLILMFKRSSDSDDTATEYHQSVRQLLCDRQADVQQLILLKNFCKSLGRRDRAASIPRPITTVLYYLAIAVALVRGGRRITSQTDVDLRKGLDWVREQPWLDDDTQRLAQELVSAIDSIKASADAP